MPTTTPTWYFPTNIPGPVTHLPQEFQSGDTPTPLIINQGFNPSMPLDTVAQQYQCDLDYPLSFSRDNISAPPLSRENSYMNNFTKQIRRPDGAGNNHSVFQFDSAPLMGERYVSEKFGSPDLLLITCQAWYICSATCEPWRGNRCPIAV